MKSSESFRHEQKAAMYIAMLMFGLLLLLLQMWLFVATLDNFLEGRYDIASVAALLSLVCLGINVWMLIGLRRVEEMS